MKEKDVVNACITRIKADLPGAFVWKIADRATGGIPDLEINWNRATTKIEFKLLKKNEWLHDKWEDERQLVTCVKLEQQTTRCWVVAYQCKCVVGERPRDLVHIYRPTALLDRKLPSAQRTTVVFCAEDCLTLWDNGALRCLDFNPSHVVNLVKHTH